LNIPGLSNVGQTEIHTVEAVVPEYKDSTAAILFIDFKKSYDSVRRGVLYIFIKFIVTMKLLRLIKMGLN
jgi:hypothetical protein